MTDDGPEAAWADLVDGLRIAAPARRGMTSTPLTWATARRCTSSPPATTARCRRRAPHRNVPETVTSGPSLFAAFRSTYSDEVDPLDVGRTQAQQTELWFRRAQAFRADPAAAAATFVDLAYTDLVADPAAALRTIYAAASTDPPADVTALVAAYDEAHPRHAHGTHRYRPEDFGLDPAELRERFSFLDEGPGGAPTSRPS